MSQQVKQKFQRTVKNTVQTNRIILTNKSSQSLVKNSILQNQFQSSPKKSQFSIDENYQFVIKNQLQYQNIHNVNLFVAKLKRIIHKRQLNCFYLVKLFKLSKDKIYATLPYLSNIIRSIIIKKKYQLLIKLKLNAKLFHQKRIFAKHISTIYKRKFRQNVSFALLKLRNNKTQKKLQDYTEMKSKIQLSLSKNQHSTKSLQSISQIVNPKQSKRLLSPRSMQKQTQFQKFAQSIDNNLTKDKDYQLAKINTMNLIKKFNREQKFKQRIRVYEVLNQLLNQTDKSMVSIKQSNNIFVKMVNFLDPLNPSVSITNCKQIKKQIMMIRTKIQPIKKPQNINKDKDDKGEGLMHKKAQNTYFQTVEKLAQLLGNLFNQILTKNSQKSKYESQSQSRLLALTKQHNQIKKKILMHEQNQTIFQNILLNFTDLQTLNKQLTELIRKSNKRKNDFPFNFLTKLNQFITVQRKNINDSVTAFKNLGNLYFKKNIREQAVQQQRNKINEKYESNYIYTSLQPHFSQAIQNAIEKQRQIFEVQNKKFKLENQKLVRQLEAQKPKQIIPKASQTPKPSTTKTLNKKSSQQSQTPINQNSNPQQLSKDLKISQRRIKQLQVQLKQIQKCQIQNDLVNQTLWKMFQKVQKKDQTWMKDVEILKNGRNKAKYQNLFKIADILSRVIQENNNLNQSLVTFKIQDISKKDSFNINLQNQVQLMSKGISQRISWDLSSHVNQIEPKHTSSFMIQQNLLQQSGIQFLRQSKNPNLYSPAKKLQMSPLQSKNVQTLNASQQMLISPEQIQVINSVLIKTLSDQFPINYLKSNQFIKIKNPYFANLVILLQSFTGIKQKLIESNRINNQLEIFVHNYEQSANNQRSLNEFVSSCNSDLDKNVFIFNQLYWQNKINSIQKPSLILMKLSNLCKKISLQAQSNMKGLQQEFNKKLIQKYNQAKKFKSSQQIKQVQTSHSIQQKTNRAQKLNFLQNNLPSLQWLQQKNNLQQQIAHLSHSLSLMEKIIKQNQEKYKAQLSYYQRMQQKSARSAYHIHESVQSKKSIRSSKSVRSLKSAQSSDAKSSNKIDHIKNYYKQSLEQFSNQQKKLLQRIQALTIQKQNISASLSTKQYQIRQYEKRILELETQVLYRQKNQHLLTAKYQSDFDSLRQDLQIVKLQVAKQVQRKDQELQYYKQAYQILVKKYQQLSITKQIISNKQQSTPHSKQQNIFKAINFTPQLNFQHQNQIKIKLQASIREQFQQRIFMLEQIVTNLQQQKQLLNNQFQIQKKYFLAEYQKQRNLLLNDNIRMNEIVQLKQGQIQNLNKQINQLLEKNKNKVQLQTQEVLLQNDNQLQKSQKQKLKQQNSQKQNSQKLQKYENKNIIKQNLSLNLKQQKLQLLQNNITQDLHHENNLPKIQQSQSMNTSTTQDIRKVDENTYIVTRTTTSHGQNIDNMRQINQVQQLKLRIQQMQIQRNQIIQNEIIKALKSQQEQFNQFLSINNQQIQQHFYNVIIPEKIKLFQLEYINTHPQSSMTQKTSSSVTNLVTSNTNLNIDFNEQQFVNKKYQQWKLTYLPVILQLKYKQWLEKYQTNQLEIILKKKYQEWENIRLLAIMKQKKNQWILDQLFNERTLNSQKQWLLKQEKWQSKQRQWQLKQQEIIKLRIKQNNQYWQKTVLPLKFKQWETTHVSNSVTVSTIHYSQADLDRIIAEEQIHWQRQFDSHLQMKIHQVQQYWESHILPQRQKQWSIKLKSQQTATVDLSNIDSIINAKYQEWKHTYLVEYLKIQREKWLQQFKRTQLQLLINKKYAEWQSLRLLSIVKDPKNSWVVEAVLKQKLFQWQKQREQQWVKKIRDIELYWQNTILVQKRRQWERQYVLLHPIQQPQVVVKQVIKQVKGNLDEQIRKYQLVWRQSHQQQLRAKLQQVQLYWQTIINDERNLYQQNLQNSLQLRTQQIQNHWQTLIIPQLRLQWQQNYIVQHPAPVLRSHDQQERTIELRVQQRIQEWKKIQLTKILQSKRQQWYLTFMNGEFITIISNKQKQWHQLQQQQFNIRLNTVLAQQRQRILLEEKHRYQLQIKNYHSGQDKAQIQRLMNLLSQNEMKYSQTQSKHRQIQSRYRDLQSRYHEFELKYHKLEVSKNQIVSNKQAVYKLQTQHIKQLNQLKLKYQDKISQLTHQKSLLTMQIKQIQINMQKSKPKQININSIQSSYQKQLLSLQATIHTKQSQITFLKKSLDSSSLQNNELNNRITNLNSKIMSLESTLNETKDHSIKFQYEIKYLKQKELTLMKKIESKQVELNELRIRFENQKNIYEKRLREVGSNNQSLSALQIKLSELQSQLSLKISNIKSLQNDLQRRKRQIEEQKSKFLNISRQIQMYKSTIKQHESIVQDLRLQIRKSCDQINRQKLMIQTFQQKQRSYHQQMRKYELKSRDSKQFEQIIRQNERLRLQNYRIKERLILIESNESQQIIRLKSIIHQLEIKIQKQIHHYREGDYTEIQVLKKINLEISDLVSSNKQLQMRIIVLQNQKQLSAFGISIQRFFVAFQQQMDNLINYLVNNKILQSSLSLNLYNKFQHKSRQALSHGYVEDYFRQWQTFMRGVIQQNYEQNVKLNSKVVRTDEQADQIIQKYDAVLNDVKYVFGQYLKTGDQEYLQLMSKSLGLDNQELLIKQTLIQRNGVQIQEENIKKQQNLVHQ